MRSCVRARCYVAHRPSSYWSHLLAYCPLSRAKRGNDWHNSLTAEYTTSTDHSSLVFPPPHMVRTVHTRRWRLLLDSRREVNQAMRKHLTSAEQNGVRGSSCVRACACVRVLVELCMYRVFRVE
jgi:hypothetical protein